jgi:hypothetical protein
MLPLLRPGDIVRIERRERLRRGDIVAAEIAGTPAIHRIASVSAQGIVCWGDHCRRRDPIMPAPVVYGVATVVTPGRRLRGGPTALVLARARYWLLVVPWAARSVVDDVSLGWRQATGAPLPPTRYVVRGPKRPFDGSLALLDAEVAARLLGLSGPVAPGSPRVGDEAPASEPSDASVVEVRAELMSGLSAEDRRRLLGRLSGRRVVLWGVLAQSPRVRFTAALRRTLASLGVSVGEPGDAALRDASGGWRPFHYFTPEGLAAELVAAGAREVEASIVTTLGGGGYVRATAQL